MFRWVPWLFDLQYRLFMGFAPTRWFSMKMLTLLGRRGPDAADPRAQPGRDRLDLSGRDRGAGRAAKNRAAEGARLLVDHRPCRHAVLGPSGDRPALRHPSGDDRGGRAASPARAASAGPSRRPRRRSSRRARATTLAVRSALPTDDTKVIAVSGGGWGVGDLLGATRAALAGPGRDRAVPVRAQRQAARAGVARASAGEPRLRVMGFTDRMGDVLAASDALVHSSAGLTVLEAIIRGCPVISYGFGYGHVRVSQPGARALRPGAGRAQGAPTSGPRSSARSSTAPSPTARSRAGRRPRR